MYIKVIKTKDDLIRVSPKFPTIEQADKYDGFPIIEGEQMVIEEKYFAAIRFFYNTDTVTNQVPI